LLVSCEEWHFNTSHASAKELEDFQIEDMAIVMKRLAPNLWLLLDMLLMGDKKHLAERSTIDLDEDYVMGLEVDEGDDLGSHEGRGISQKNMEWQEALCIIVCAAVQTASDVDIAP